MRRRTDAAFVWVYTPKGVRVINADDVLKRSKRNLLGGRRLDQLFAGTLACTEGDEHIGIPAGRLAQGNIGSMLKDLRAEQKIAIDIADVQG